MEKVDFNGKELFIGLDVHKKSWSVSIFSTVSHFKTFSQPSSPKALKTYLDSHFPNASIKCAYEASKFGFWIQRELSSYGYECLVVNPADIPSTHKENVEKTDPVDSRKIGRALRAGQLTGIHIPKIETEGLRQLFRYRKKLWADLVRTKNRIKDRVGASGISLPAKFDNAQWTHAFIKWLRELELPSIPARTTLDLLLEQYDMLKAHLLKTGIAVRKTLRQKGFKELGKLLRGIPGIGPLTSVQLIVEIEDIHRFPSFKHFNSFIGLKPTTHSSGDKERNGFMTHRRHNALRSSIVECSWTAIQQDPALLTCYEEFKKRMNGKRAIVKIARKLLARIYHVWKTGEPYQMGLMAT
jgi:transposase